MFQMLKIIELSNDFLYKRIKLFYIGSKLQNCFVFRIPGSITSKKHKEAFNKIGSP